MSGPRAYRGACLALLAAATLAGCATPPTRPAPVAVIRSAPPPPAAPAPAPAPASKPATPAGFWAELRSGFDFARCNDSPAVTPWTRRYTRHPDRLTRSLAKALPRLRYIANIFRQQQIPTEFALLPWVESSFRVLPGHGDGPAGLWQIMPATGRSLGLRIDYRYDGRLDLDDSTRAVARLLKRYDKALGDWRLADLAYNTGMYRVARLVNGLDSPIPDTAAVPDIGVSDTTRNHLAKLTAIACIVRAPDRFGITLPDPHAAPTLERATLRHSMPLALIARLADSNKRALQPWNLGNRDPSRPLSHVLLPDAATAQHFHARYAELERHGWTRWDRVELHRATTLAALVSDPSGRTLLANLNRVAVGAKLAADARAWLPAKLAAALPDDTLRIVPIEPPTHRVVAGDNLWTLARRFHVQVADLKLWNGLKGNLLRLGQSLRLAPPDDFPAATDDALN